MSNATKHGTSCYNAAMTRNRHRLIDHLQMANITSTEANQFRYKLDNQRLICKIVNLDMKPFVTTRTLIGFQINQRRIMDYRK